MALALAEAGSAEAQSVTVNPTGPVSVLPDESSTYTCAFPRSQSRYAARVVSGNTYGRWALDGDSSSVSISWSAPGQYTVSCVTATNVTLGSLTVTVGSTGPTATIAAGTGITEGGSAAFTVSLSEEASAALTVNVSVTQVGNYVSGNYSTVTVAQDASTAVLSVATTDDSVDEANGSITVTITSGTGYQVGATAAATLAVADNDVPAVSVAAGSSVTEGTASVFTLTASPTPYQNIIVNLTVGQTGDYVAAENRGSKTVTLTTSGTVTYPVATVNDNVSEANGAATLTVNAGVGYAPAASPNNTASGTVTDDDSPQISIVAGDGINEGGNATFTLTASPTPYQNITVNLTVSQTGDYVEAAHRGDKMVVIGTSGTATYSVPTMDDLVTEANGTVVLTVTAGTGYRLPTVPSASVNVIDDDITLVEVTGGNAVTEGSFAVFTFSTDPALSAPTTVSFTVGQTGSFVAGANRGTKSITLNPAVSSSYTYSVPTIDDNIHEVNGSVTVTVQDAAAYNPGTASVGSVTVNDNDDLAAPVVTVSGTGTQSFTLAWADLAGGVGISYSVQYRRSVESSWRTWDYANHGRTIVGLLPNTPYLARVQGIGQRAPSPWSELVSTTTSTGPDAPTVTLADRDGGSLTLSFTTPHFRGTTVQGYAVRYRKVSVDDWTDYGQNLGASIRRFTISSLAPGTSYMVQTRALPNVGEGAWGSVTASTASTADRVSYLAYSMANSVSATLIWDSPPASSYSISRYELRYRENRSPSPPWTEVTSISPSLSPTYRIAGLTAGLAYEAQVRAINSQGPAPWSASLFFETNAGLFDNNPPRNLEAERVAQSGNQIVVRAAWEKVVDANDYQVDFRSATTRSLHVTEQRHLELTYNIPPDDTGGTFRLSVRGRRVAGDDYTYTPWAPAVPLAYFIDRTVEADQVLVAEIGGTRQVSAGVMTTRDDIGDAINEVGGISGFEPDTQGILDFMAMVPALLILGVSIYGGMKFRAVGLAVGVGSVLALIAMYAGSNLLGLDIIWPMLGTFGILFVGTHAVVRRYNIEQPFLVYAVLFLALHAAAVFAQNMAGYSLTGAADYGDSLWSGTPLDDFLAIRKLDSYFDLRALFTALGDTLIGLFRLVVFDYEAFKGHSGAALLFVSLITLLLSLSSSSLILSVIRQLFSTGIFNSAAGLALVVGGVGIAAVISTVTGADTGTPRVTIVAEQQGLAVEEGSPVAFTILAEPAPERPLQIVLTVAQTGSYVRASDIGNKLITVPTDGFASYSLLTYEDNLNAEAGAVTVSVGEGEGYELRNPTQATVIIAPKVVDAYLVSIWPDNQGVPADEGEDAAFRIASDPSPTEPLTVSLEVTTTGSYVKTANTGSKMVTIPTSGEAIYSVPTETVVGHVSGSVTVTLASGSGYSLVSPTAATVAVEPSLPLITVAAGTSVSEGTPAQFTFTAEPAPASDLTVRFAVEESGKYLAGGQAGFKTVTIPPAGTVTYSVATEVDGDIEESDGYVQVQLVEDEANYVVGSLNAARVDVLNVDTSIPTVTVTGPASVTEGYGVRWAVRAVPVPTQNLTVRYGFSEEGDFAPDNTPASGTFDITTTGVYYFDVRARQDTVDEPNGAFTLTLFAPTDGSFRVGSPASARVEILDND